MQRSPIYIPAYLRAFTEGCDQVELGASPATVGEALEALWALYPGMRDRVLTEQGQVRPHINVFVGRENIRYDSGLSTAVPDGSEISIIPAVSGGCAPVAQGRITQLRIADCGMVFI